MAAPHNIEDRFSQPAPTYTPPKSENNFGVLEAPKRNSIPAIPLREQRNNKRVQELLSQAKALSGQLAKDAQEIKEKTTVIQAISGKIKFCQAHIMSDRQFITTTRHMSIHDKGAMSLLLANGGQRFLLMGFLPAQALDLLRKEKMNKLQKLPNSSFDRRPKMVYGKIYVAGIPTIEERKAKIGLHLVEDKKNNA